MGSNILYIEGTGATLTWYTGPGGTGTNLGSGSPLVITPTSGFNTYYAYISGTCNTVETSVTASVGGAANVILTPVTVPVAVVVCEDGPWSYYEDPTNPNKYIFAVRWGATNAAAKAAAIISVSINGAPIWHEATRSTGIKDASYILPRYWNVDIGSNTLVDPVDIKFFYDPAEIASITADRDAELTALNLITPGRYFAVPFRWFKTVGMPFSAGLINDGNNFAFPSLDLPAAGSGTESGVTYVEFDGIPSFSGGTGGVGISPFGGISLPVSITTIEAVPVKNQYIQVRWTTVLEVNNQGFDVMRSEDGFNFVKVGYVNGHNNSTVTNNYTFDDKAVNSNKMYYYKLRQIDNDGKSSETKIVNAMITGGAALTVGEFYPNPTNNKTSIDIFNVSDKEMTLKVYDMIGNLVHSETNHLIRGNNKMSIDMNNLADGNYSAVITFDGREVSVKKIVVQK